MKRTRVLLQTAMTEADWLHACGQCGMKNRPARLDSTARVHWEGARMEVVGQV